MQHESMRNVSSQCMCEHDNIIVVIGKRKLFDSHIEALKSHKFDDVATSEAREIKKPNKKIQSQEDFSLSTTQIAVPFLSGSIANMKEPPLSVEEFVMMPSTNFDSNVSFL